MYTEVYTHNNCIPSTISKYTIPQSVYSIPLITVIADEFNSKLANLSTQLTEQLPFWSSVSYNHGSPIRISKPQL